MLRSLEALTLVEGQHHGLGDQEDGSRRDSQAAPAGNERRVQWRWRVTGRSVGLLIVGILKDAAL